MYKITEKEVETEILNNIIPLALHLREKLIRKVNESYQYNSKFNKSVKSGDYSVIVSLLDWHIFNFC